MKTSIIQTLFVSAFTTLFSSSLQAQVPNPGFENWHTTTINGKAITDPVNWSTMNMQTAFDNSLPSATKTTDAYQGSYALKLTNQTSQNMFPAFAGSLTDEATYNQKFPVSTKIKSISGYYKYEYQREDTFTITLDLFVGNRIIGSARFQSSAAKATYTPFTAEVEYYEDTIPDSASVVMFAGTFEDFKIGSSLTIDALSLSTFSTGIGTPGETILRAAVSPNPVHGHATITFEQAAGENVSISVFDILGHQVQEIASNTPFAAGINNVTWNPAALPRGVYFVRVQASSTLKTMKVYLQ